MTEQLTLLYSIGFVAFLAATVVAFQNHLQTHRITPYWLIVAGTGVTGMLWTGSYIPGSAGVDIISIEYSHLPLAVAALIGYTASGIVALTTDATIKLL